MISAPDLLAKEVISTGGKIADGRVAYQKMSTIGQKMVGRIPRGGR